MINKNRFSIKDTKKVLHKVGKRWVVVSAVLLGLAAGGAAVTTANANAANTQAAQPQTTAQQVNKNANMSAANHSFGAADPANTTKAPASSTMKLGADNGISGLVNSVKSDAQDKLANHNLPSNISGLKSYAKSKASSADVTHLTDLANLARSNGKQNKYNDLVNLANNNNARFNNIKVGSDTTTNSNADTVFGMLNNAYGDVSAINSGAYSNSTVSKVAHYLSDAQKLANSTVSHTFDASQLDNMIGLAGASELPTSVSVSGSSSSINLTNLLANYLNIPSDIANDYFSGLSMTGSVSDTTVSVNPSYTVSLNIPSVINSGINVSSAVSSAVNGVVTTASNSIQSQASNVTSGIDSQILNQLGNNNTGIISNLNSDIANIHANPLPIENVMIHSYISSTVNSVGGKYDISSSNLNSKMLTPEFQGLKHLKPKIYNKLSEANNILNESTLNESTINKIYQKYPNLNLTNMINSLYASSASIDSYVTTDVDVELSGSDSANSASKIVDPITGAQTNSAIYNVNSVIAQSASTDFSSEVPASSIASKVTNKLYGMGIGGQNKLFGPFTSDTVSPSAAYNFLTSNNSANANTISSLLSQFNISNASGKVNRIISIFNKANAGLYDFDNSSANYNSLVSTAANLTNTDTNYSNADSAYKAIASDASNLNSQLSSASNEAKAVMHGANIPKYSDISGYISTEIMSEANSSANSMESTSSSMSSALKAAYNASTDAKNNNKLSTNDKTLENSLLSASNTSVKALLAASASYNSHLNGQNTSMALDNITVNFTGASTGSINLMGFSGESFNINNNTFDIPANDTIASAPASFTFNGSSANAIYNDDNPIIVSLSTSSSSNSSSSSSKPSSAGSSTQSSASTNNNFIPTFNGGSSMISESSSTSAAPTSVATNNISSVASKKKHAANYVKVNKALQLHTNPNFTKRNAKAVLEPGTTFKIERLVKAHNGALRYEVKYNKKNYFITANKHWVHAYYKANEHTHANLKNYIHYRYAKVVRALQLHTHARFTKRNGVKVVRPGTEFHITNIVKSGKYVRYEVRYQGHSYFITANHKYTVNAYVQNYNYRKHGYKAVRVIKPMNEYRKLNFAKRSFIRHFYRGSVLPVKKVITIGKGEMTRLELTNGRYVTANKDFVEPIR